MKVDASGGRRLAGGPTPSASSARLAEDI